MKRVRFFLLAFLFLTFNSIAQTLPTPASHFGFAIGDDYMLANYTQTEAYFKKLAAASNKVKLVDIGLTEEGRHQYMLVVSSADNLGKLERYKQISQQLARAEGLTDEQARTLAAEGKAVVWIDGGLHATETVGAHQLIETIYQVVSRNDAETQRILNDVIILFVHANPDGQELVSDWYMRNPKPEQRSFRFLPRQYQKYIGHDNNRDFYMMNMKETQNMSRQIYVEWLPQILYNHHQTGPAGSVLAGPPYRDPFNFVYDPLLITSLDAVGAAMNNRLNVEGKPGYTQRSGSVFSTWWNGGMRTTPYFHNIIGILTEIIGSPTPAAVPLVPSRLVPNGATPNPVTPQTWKFRQSIDYSVSLNYAVLDHASRQKEHLLFNIYKMGRNAIEAGSKDHWTLTPTLIDSISNAFRKDQKMGRNDVIRTDTLPVKYYDVVYKDPTLRDPRGYIIPANQPDMPTAVKFINALLYSGIKVQKANTAFTVEGKQYPAGSFIVPTAQAFRPHVIDMFEPQDHPNDFRFPGGPPVPPYDAAGWTPAYTMGIRFERVLNPFSGPFQTIAYGDMQSLKTTIAETGNTAGYLLNGASNHAYTTVNDLLKNGIEVYRVTKTEGDATTGSFFVPSKGKALLSKAATDWGITVTGMGKRPASLVRVTPKKIALFESYGGSEPTGWAKWILEQYHFPAQIIYPKDLDAGTLKEKFDVIVFATGSIPAVGARGGASPRLEDIPQEYRSMLGRITADTTVPQLRRFLEAGGTIVTIGSSNNLVYHLKLPVRNALTEMVNGEERSLPNEKFYIPGSVMQVEVDASNPAAWGMDAKADVMFARSPVFRLPADAVLRGEVKPLVWFGSDKSLRSGWAWGQDYLKDAVAAFEARIGKGKLYAFGPEIIFRGQSQGTYKLLFNQLYQLQ
jgi:hypothetical protein